MSTCVGDVAVEKIFSRFKVQKKQKTSDYCLISFDYIVIVIHHQVIPMAVIKCNDPDCTLFMMPSLLTINNISTIEFEENALNTM